MSNILLWRQCAIREACMRADAAVCVPGASPAATVSCCSLFGRHHSEAGWSFYDTPVFIFVPATSSALWKHQSPEVRSNGSEQEPVTVQLNCYCAYFGVRQCRTQSMGINALIQLEKVLNRGTDCIVVLRCVCSDKSKVTGQIKYLCLLIEERMCFTVFRYDFKLKTYRYLNI